MLLPDAVVQEARSSGPETLTDGTGTTIQECMKTTYTIDSMYRLVCALLGPSWEERRAADWHLFAILGQAPEGMNPALMRLVDGATEQLGLSMETFLSELTAFWMSARAQVQAESAKFLAATVEGGTWPMSESAHAFPLREPVRVVPHDMYGQGAARYLVTQARRLGFLVDAYVRGLAHPDLTVSDACWEILGSVPGQARSAIEPMLDIAFHRGAWSAPGRPMRQALGPAASGVRSAVGEVVAAYRRDNADAEDVSGDFALLRDRSWMTRADAAGAAAQWPEPSEELVRAVAELLGDCEGHDGQPHETALATLMAWGTRAAPAMGKLAAWMVSELDDELPGPETVWALIASGCTARSAKGGVPGTSSSGSMPVCSTNQAPMFRCSVVGWANGASTTSWPRRSSPSAGLGIRATARSPTRSPRRSASRCLRGRPTPALMANPVAAIPGGPSAGRGARGEAWRGTTGWRW